MHDKSKWIVVDCPISYIQCPCGFGDWRILFCSQDLESFQGHCSWRRVLKVRGCSGSLNQRCCAERHIPKIWTGSNVDIYCSSLKLKVHICKLCKNQRTSWHNMFLPLQTRISWNFRHSYLETNWSWFLCRTGAVTCIAPVVSHRFLGSAASCVPTSKCSSNDIAICGYSTLMYPW